MWTTLRHLLCAAALTLAVPAVSHASVFWNDGFEPGEYFAANAWLNNTLIPQGSYTYDTVIKHGGTRSLRQNFTKPPAPDCQLFTPQCGGSITRAITPTAESYMRWWIRIGGDTNQGATIPGTNGLFEAYVLASTKMVEGKAFQSSPYSRYWIGFGHFGISNKNLFVTVENTPTSGHSTEYWSNPNFAFQDNRWYCVEAYMGMNTPAVANGKLDIWVDGVNYIHSTVVPWRNSGATTASLWQEWQTDRQGGRGNIWYDDVATGDTRIGCGSVPSDTTPPPVPNAPTIPTTGLPATVNWSAVSNVAGDLAGYNYYRKLEACSGAGSMVLITTLGNVLTYDDVSIPGATTRICVKLASRDTSGNVSAQSTGTDKILPATGTFSHVATINVSSSGADLTFNGNAYKIRYWNDTSTAFCTSNPSLCSNNRIEVTGLGGVLSYTLSVTWSGSISFVCAEAQGSDGAWETVANSNSYLCGGLAHMADVTPPLKPTGLRRR